MQFKINIFDFLFVYNCGKYCWVILTDIKFDSLFQFTLIKKLMRRTNFNARIDCNFNKKITIGVKAPPAAAGLAKNT